MFIDTHIDDITGNDQSKIALTFLKSRSVQVFPCGRRRSTFIPSDLDNIGGASATEGYRIPFDPESRLNTEANNRKHSSLNGFTQTYFNSWDNRGDSTILSMALAGYLFNIILPNSYDTKTFGYEAFNKLKDKQLSVEQAILEKGSSNFDKDAFKQEFENKFNNEYSHIYANVLIENVKLFSGTDLQTYYTGVLHNQSASDNLTDPVLDLLVEESDPAATDSYYFSGLSFSVEPLTGIEPESIAADDIYSNDAVSVKFLPDAGEAGNGQLLVSLCLLEKVGMVNDGETTYTWQIHEQAKLPKIYHGPTDGSIAIGDLYTKRINTPSAKITKELSVSAYGDINLTAKPEYGYNGSINAVILKRNDTIVPLINVEPTDDGYYQLHIDLGNN